MTRPEIAVATFKQGFNCCPQFVQSAAEVLEEVLNATGSVRS